MRSKATSLVILLLATLFMSQEAGAPVRSRPPPPPKPIHIEEVVRPGVRETHELHNVTEDISAQRDNQPRPYAETANEKESKLEARYNRVIRELAKRLDILAINVDKMASAYAEARHKNVISNLTGNLSWLSMRTTGRKEVDVALAKHTQQLAGLYFERPWNMKKVNVLATGLSQAASKKIDDLQPDQTTRINLAKVEEALTSEVFPVGSALWRKHVGEQLRPFTGSLLILVAHHSSGENSKPGKIKITHNNVSTEISADTLMSVARESGVNLFLLGCSTATSANLGTMRPFSVDDAIGGIERIYATPIATYGQVFERLVRGDLQIVFDVALVADGIFEVITPQTREVVDRWRIPEPNSAIFAVPGDLSQDLNAACSVSELLRGSSPDCKNTAQASTAKQVPALDFSNLPEVSLLPYEPSYVPPPTSIQSKPFLERLADSLWLGLVALVLTACCCAAVVWVFSSTIYDKAFDLSTLGDPSAISDIYDAMFYIYIVLIVGFAYLLWVAFGCALAISPTDITPLYALLLLASGMLISLTLLRTVIRNLKSAIRQREREEAEDFRIKNVRVWIP